MKGFLEKHNLVLPLGAVTCALLWGSAFPAIKIAFTYMDSTSFTMRLAFAGMRFTIAGLVLLLILPDVGKQFRNAHKGSLWGVTLLQVGIQYALFYWGMALCSGVVSAIINATGSFWWVLLAPFFHRATWPRGSQLLILLLGFTGVCMAVYRGEGTGQVSIFGSLLILLATICATIASLLVRHLGRQVSVRFITGYALAVGGAMLLVAGAPSLPSFFAQAGWQLWTITLYLSFVSAVAFSLWYYLITRFDITTLSGYRYLIPIAGVLESAWLVPGEQLGVSTALGGFLVMAGVYLLGRSVKKEKSSN